MHEIKSELRENIHPPGTESQNSGRSMLTVTEDLAQEVIRFILEVLSRTEIPTVCYIQRCHIHTRLLVCLTDN